MPQTLGYRFAITGVPGQILLPTKRVQTAAQRGIHTAAPRFFPPAKSSLKRRDTGYLFFSLPLKDSIMQVFLFVKGAFLPAGEGQHLPGVLQGDFGDVLPADDPGQFLGAFPFPQ